MTTRLARALTSCAAAALMACGTAYAATISGSVYTTDPYPASLSPLETPPGTLLGTFTTDGINYLGTGGASYTVGGFITSNGNSETGLSSSVASQTLNNKELKLTGLVSLVAGTTYTITHDDGIYLYLNGVETIASGAPTSAENSDFSVATTGVYNFDLLYAEVNGAPGVLDFPGTFVDPTPTPEPSTFLLMGTGLLSAAGAVRRKMRA